MTDDSTNTINDGRSMLSNGMNTYKIINILVLISSTHSTVCKALCEAVIATLQLEYVPQRIQYERPIHYCLE
jgi:hypothetical protein